MSCFQEFLKPSKTWLVAGTVLSFLGYRLYKQVSTYPKNLIPVKWTETQVLILGLDKAGKTTLAQCIRFNPRQNQKLPEVESTLFWNELIVSLGGAKFHVWDIGGCFSCRQFWYKFVPNKDILIWVVDSNLPSRIEESKKALHSFLDHQQTKGMPVIIVANKQDLEHAMDPLDVLDALEIDKYQSNHRFYIVGSRMPPTGPRNFSNVQLVNP